MEMASKFNRRTIQILWVAAVLIFLLALFHTSTPAKEWATNKVGDIVNNFQSRESLDRIMARSEAVWAKTVKQRHEMIAADYGDITKMPLFPCNSQEAYKVHPYTIWDFAPASYSCPWDMERIGRMGDGGKWVCGMSRFENYPKEKECIIYSFGVRDESSFEQEMLSRTNCVVWAYDFSVVDFGQQVDQSHRDRAHFKQVAIAGKTDKNANPPLYSIADLMKENGHTYVDILKMDIETSEFEAMDGLSDDFPLSAGHDLPIGQLMVEIHLYDDHTADIQRHKDKTSKFFLDWWERLEARGLRATWTEPNLLAVTLGASAKDPVMAEYTMINVHDRRNVLFQGR